MTYATATSRIYRDKVLTDCRKCSFSRELLIPAWEFKHGVAPCDEDGKPVMTRLHCIKDAQPGVKVKNCPIIRPQGVIPSWCPLDPLYKNERDEDVYAKCVNCLYQEKACVPGSWVFQYSIYYVGCRR